MSIKVLQRLPPFLARQQPACQSYKLYYRGPAKSPRTIARETIKPSHWPLGVIRAAANEGRIPAFSTTIQILDRFVVLAPSLPDKGKVQELCSTFGIQSSDLTRLAQTLGQARRSTEEARNQVQRDLRNHAQNLINAAASVGDVDATMIRVQQLIRQSRFEQSQYHDLRQQFLELVRAKIPNAMLLMAQLYASEGHGDASWEIYEEITNLRSSKDEDDLLAIKATAWTAIAALNKTRGNRIAAEKAMEKAAVECDDPRAYYRLAKEYKSPQSPDHLPSIVKAAASGWQPAIEDLGILYFNRTRQLLRQGGRSDKQSQDFMREYSRLGYNKNPQGSPPDLLKEPRSVSESLSLAFEWLSIGAEASIPTSKFHLGILLRNGNSERGLRLVEEAAVESPKHSEEAKWFISNWHNKAIKDFLTL